MSLIWNIFFKFNCKMINFQAPPDMMFAEIVLKFNNEIGNQNLKLKFFYNSKELKSDSYKSLEELGLRNMAQIEVFVSNQIEWTIPDNAIIIKIRNKESNVGLCLPSSNKITFDELAHYISVYFFIDLEKLRFYFNSSKITDYNKTLEYYNIKDESIIDFEIYDDKKIEEDKEELIKQLNKEKEKNKELLKENSILKQKLEIFNNENKKMKKLLEKKDEQSEYSIESINPGEKILAVNFVSMGSQDIGHYNLICKNIDLFVSLEKRLYKDFPKFKDYNTYFEVNGHSIKRFKTMDENKIKNNDIINIFCNE